MHVLYILAGCVMAELPSGLLEACVVVGASGDKLRDLYQVCIYTQYTLAQRQRQNHEQVHTVIKEKQHLPSTSISVTSDKSESMKPSSVLLFRDLVL